MDVKAIVALLCLFILTACQSKEQTNALDLNTALGGIPEAGFERALAPKAFQFPADHAAHPSFRNEWWYITGNLKAATGQRFGYQVTLFRIALSPEQPKSTSVWATNQVWMAHVALTDVETKQHLHEQRFARGAAGLAGQSLNPFKVWLEDWQILGDATGDFPWKVQVKTTDFALELDLSPTKPVVLQGKQGLSQKSSAAGNASYYYSFSRLQTKGTLHYQGKTLAVSGLSWLDREWSTSALGIDQAGWDWFSLQLNDGHDLMFYRMRNTSGEADQAHTQGKWIKPDGTNYSVSLKDIQLKPIEYWQSPQGAKYPIAWEMYYPAEQRQWRIQAVVDNQLMATSILYWEGAVDVFDLKTGQVVGSGYLEMSGY